MGLLVLYRMYVCICMYVYMCVCARVCVHACMYIYVCVHVRMYVKMCWSPHRAQWISWQQMGIKYGIKELFHLQNVVDVRRFSCFIKIVTKVSKCQMKLYISPIYVTSNASLLILLLHPMYFVSLIMLRFVKKKLILLLGRHSF
jgi:hypothetical protein